MLLYAWPFGCCRETMEEACAKVQIEAPYAHWDIPAIGQAYILFRAKVRDGMCCTLACWEILRAATAKQSLSERLVVVCVCMCVTLYGTWLST